MDDCQVLLGMEFQFACGKNARNYRPAKAMTRTGARDLGRWRREEQKQRSRRRHSLPGHKNLGFEWDWRGNQIFIFNLCLSVLFCDLGKRIRLHIFLLITGAHSFSQLYGDIKDSSNTVVSKYFSFETGMSINRSVSKTSMLNISSLSSVPVLRMNIYSFNKYLESSHYLTDSILSMA